MSYVYSAEAFKSVKSAGRDALGDGTFETYVAEDGFFAVLNNFNTIDEYGFYTKLEPVYSIYSSDSAIATALEDLSTEEMAILTEVYAYRYTGFDESNTEITLFASAYNGLTDPATTVTVPDSDNQLGFYYTVKYDDNEVSGLRSKFGYQAGSSLEDQIDSAVQTMAAEVVNSYMSKRRAFRRTKRNKIQPSLFSSLIEIQTTVTGSTVQPNTTSPATTPVAATTGY